MRWSSCMERLPLTASNRGEACGFDPLPKRFHHEEWVWIRAGRRTINPSDSCRAAQLGSKIKITGGFYLAASIEE